MSFDLSDEIKKVVIFFDLFDFPLTTAEIWRFLPVGCSLGEVITALDGDSGLETQAGFYFLPGRREIVRVRLERNKQAQRKFRRALMVARYFSLFPWVRLAAVGNQIGAGNAQAGSDIDFFVVCSARRIWITRLFLAGSMRLLDLRPRAGRKQDTICLSFYVTDRALDLSCARLDQDDIYFRYWLATLVPIFDRGRYYRDLIAANAWLGKELPNWQAAAIVWPRRLDSRRHGFLSPIAWLLAGLEAPARSFQLMIMPKELKKAMNQNSNCLVNDNMLKLFVNDRREEFRGKYLFKLYGSSHNFVGDSLLIKQDSSDNNAKCKSQKSK